MNINNNHCIDHDAILPAYPWYRIKYIVYILIVHFQVNYLQVGRYAANTIHRSSVVLMLASVADDGQHSNNTGSMLGVCCDMDTRLCGAVHAITFQIHITFNC